MIPTIGSVAIKDVSIISVKKSLGDAIDAMANNNIRTIIVEDSEKKRYSVLTTKNLIDYKLDEIASSSQLSCLNLKAAETIDKGINILSIIHQINAHDEYMIVTDDDKIFGMVSYTDIINNIDPKELIQKQSIGSLIINYKITTVLENSSTINALKCMKQNNNDAVIIINEESTPIGIFTTKDFIHIMRNDSCLEEPIKKYMSKPIKTVNRNFSIANSLEFLKKEHFKRLIVVDDDNQLAGIVTQKEILRLVYNKWVEILKSRGDKIAKENEELIEMTNKLEKKVSIDYLTKIYNRQKLDSFLEYEISQVKRHHDRNLSIVIIDIDNFKKINDNFGHLCGDNVLQEIAKILTLCSRDCDIVARWGGEEFVIMLPNTDIENTLIVAEKLRATIEKHIFDKIMHLTCSFGIAQFHDKDNKQNFFNRADSALYRAKKMGKNRVEIEYLD